MPRKRTTTDDTSKPKAKALHTAELTQDEMDKVGEWCEAHEWEFANVEYAQFSYKGEGVVVTGYAKEKKGKYKLVVAGKKAEEWVRFTLEAEITGAPQLGYEAVNHPDWFELHAGMDESGKGDFFGPIICCTVIADGDMVRHWRENGIQDSKNISSDKAILKLDKLIRETDGVVVKRMALRMPKYNELWGKFGRNVNRLMGWMHATALNSALEERHAPWGLLDQFSKTDHVGKLVKAPHFELRQRTKAESDPVVAAASICARAEYVRRMDELSKEAGMKLLKGASAQVKQQGVDLVKKLGPDRLGDFAKLHFKTAQQVLDLAG